MAIALGPVSATAADLNPRPGCDVSVVFKARKGSIDTSSYERLQHWLQRTDEISSFQDVQTSGKGRKLCMTVLSREEIRPVYRAVTLMVDRSFGGGAPVKVENRFGGLYERKPYRSWGPSSQLPRNNGISERPPLGNRN
ncbi:hypothetical protein [Caulobacter sp. NIBR1757]|uniref:hypothetical protein n=1 Tax=Caulobacter sp. NIBR1757 TaxID=3016000 RepID=UPI0022F1143C|nr:hypothetical protein [Caulobacter sp. NIBR1757]